MRPRVVGVVELWKDFLSGDWNLSSPGAAGPRRWSEGEFLGPRWLHEPQLNRNHLVGLGFLHPAGWYRPGGCALSSPGCWSCRDMEGVLIRGWKRTLPGRGGTSALTRGATLAARRLHGPQPISNHLLGLGFLHPAGRHRSGGYVFSSPGCRSCICMEGFLIRGWDPVLPAWRWIYS